VIGRDILEAIRPVIEALEQLGIPYYIGGSVASSALGIPRSTLDADIIADIKPKHIQALVQLLEDDYYIVDSMVGDAIRRRASFNIIRFSNSIKIDVFIPRNEPFDVNQFRRKQSIELGEGERARSYEVASPEDLVLQKLSWYKMGGKTSERQWLDALGILKLNSATLDAHHMIHWAAIIGVSDLLEKAFLDAGLSPTGEIEF
jgi:hypothetical protein